MIPCKNEELCTGCGACLATCSFGSIQMKSDEMGCPKAFIDIQKCRKCGKCYKVCPENLRIEPNQPKQCYAATVKDDYTYKTTSSGGAASVFSRYMIDKGGVAFGATFAQMKVKHIAAYTIEQLEQLKGSKYVQSDMTDVYSEIAKLNKNDTPTIFIGTPCQVAALKAFQKTNKNSNVIYIDLICHGTPPMKYLREYISSLHKAEDITDVVFRKKDWTLGIRSGEKSVYNRINVEDGYCSAFSSGMIFRENCYSCKYARQKRIGDITIGDFWGLGKSSLPERAKSVILINTEQGQSLWNACKDLFDWEEREIDEAIAGNSQLRHPSICPKERACFEKRYKRYGFCNAIKWTKPVLRAKLIRLKHSLRQNHPKEGEKYGLTIIAKS